MKNGSHQMPFQINNLHFHLSITLSGMRLNGILRRDRYFFPANLNKKLPDDSDHFRQ
jgi:hypothetical protein